MTEPNVVMEIKNLQKYFPVTQGVLKRIVGHVRAVDDISLSVRQGEVLGIVGESGCGKTTLGKCLVRLLKPTKGELQIKIGDRMVDLLSLDKTDSFKARRRIQMVFQDPYSSLNPVKNIFTSFDEPLRIHKFGNRRKRQEIIAETLQTVNLQPNYMYRYPHEFSGGQRQRICIARALSLQPEIIVCDEPVSALDVSIQAQILNLMKSLQRQYNLTFVFIAHDLSVVEYMSDRIAVMYMGKVVELANADEMYSNYAHPYTEALISAVPMPVLGARKERTMLTGEVPSPMNPPLGCRFHPRCPRCMEICRKVEPELNPYKGDADHLIACHLYDNCR